MGSNESGKDCLGGSVKGGLAEDPGLMGTLLIPWSGQEMTWLRVRVDRTGQTSEMFWVGAKGQGLVIKYGVRGRRNL